MATWIIYGSNNVAKAKVKELELHDEWMAECYLTISVKSATPIAFAVGDYIDYRGERYTIQYDPNVIKKATSGSYGEGFTYDNIKFVGLQDEVVRCDFNDIVLNDNDIHYSALPTFPFYCESVDDLLDRIQANLEDLYPGQWIIIGLNTVRNAQRGDAVGRAQAFLNAYKQYIDPTGAANTDPYGKQGVAETADNITCWDAMKKVHDDFDLNFIVRGRVIVVGTAGVFTANTFRYGKGNGLYELERIGESDQRIVTRLRAYGSEQNLPAHYYNTINKQVYATVTSILHKFDTTGADFLLNLDFDRKYFTYRSESYPGTTEAPNYIIEMMANDVTVRGYVTKDATTGKCYVYCESVAGDDDRDEPDATKMAAFVQALTANDRLDFVEYVNKDAFGTGHYDYGTGHLPDNMAVSRLMLPGFPTMSLHAWVQAHKDDADKAWLAQAIADGFTFSNEVYRPYIDSPNKNQYGVRPGSIYFDGSDDTEDVHPTIEGMTYNGAPIDEVYAADQVEDNGVYPAGEEVKNIKITLPVLGFELDKVYEDGASIDMKNGMCGARSFKMAGTPKKDANGRWVCTVERVHDDALDLWFPYCDFQIHGSSEVGREHGDNYVLTGIDMPAAYIEAASVRLLQESIEALKKNHAPRYTYQPRIDELWMQRQHDTATASQGVASLHDTLKAGDIFAFADTDLNIDANVIIDVLTIRENGNNGIPTYEVTLRDEKQVGTIQKITNKVDSIISGATQVNGAGGGLTVRQVQSLIDRFGGEQFLSKLNDDTAAGFITMLKGLQIGNGFASGILGEGGVLRKRDSDGKVELEVDILYARMKAYFDTVEVREYQHTGGNRIASVAGNRICRVEWYNSSNQVLEQAQANLSSVAYFRCYFRASDGEDTVKNNWVVGDMAYCHITSIANSSDNPEQKGANQKHLWRLVIGRNTEGTLTEDGEAYIDLSNRSTETISSESYAGYQSGSDAPSAQDDIIQLGNVNDSTRQGAIVEFVTGTDAPSYQIYQGIGQKVGSDASSIYSLTSKNQIGFGYNTSTGRAYLNVYGDFRFGARPNTQGSYLEYNSQTGALNIKAHVEFTNSDAELDTLVQSHQKTYDNAIAALIQETEDLQAQIDGAIESYFMTGAPSLTTPPVMNSGGSTYAEPWLDGTETQEERIAILNKHIGDLYYDKATGHGYRFMYDSDNSAYVWTILTDEDVTEALALAAQAQATADGKSTTFLNNTSDQDETKRYPKNYKKGDTWILQVDATINGVAYKAGDILTTSADSTTYNAAHWSKQVRYTDDSTVNNFISNTYSPFAQNIQTQVDKKAETWRQATNPASSWTTEAEKAKHVGDLWMDTANGKKTYIYQNTAAAGATPVYDWVAQDVPDDVFTKIDGKAAIYVGWEDWIVDGVSQLQDKDLYIPNTDHNPYKANKVYRWKASNSTWNEISYTDDTYAHNFDYLKAAMKGDTQIQGGLLLSNAVVLRNVEQGVSTDIMSGINGVLNTDLVNPLKSIAAWYGGDMLDREAASDSSSSSSEEEEEPRYAKSLLRFDGSGYLASGNITWDATGRVTIKDLHTDDGGTPTDVLQEMSAFRGMFDLSVWASATRIKPLQYFEQLQITRPSGYTITDSDVLTRNENDARYMVTDRFKALFRVYNGNSDITDSFFTNGLPSDTSNVSIKAMFDFWSQGGITALGQGSQGGGGGSTTLYGLNDVSKNDAGDGVLGAADGYVLTYNASTNHWYAAATAETYVLPQATANALGGIKIGYNDSTPKTYAVALNSAGQAYVAVPWTDHHAWGDISNKPTTISGYGITDAYTKKQVDSLVRLKSVALASDGVLAFELQDGSMSYADLTHQHDFQEILDKPTTLAGFGITDAKIESGVITLGGNTITPVTSVAMTVPTGFSISGTPISKTGTLALSYSSGYEGFTTDLKNMITALYSWFEVDSNGDIKTKDYTSNGTTKHRGFWSPSFISALGQGSDSGGGGQGDVTWELLKQADTRPINISHLTGALSGYATQSWVTSQGYVTTSGMNTAINALTYLNSVSLNNDGSVVFGGHGIENTIVDLSHQHSFLELLDRPTTIAGYGITDAITTSNIGSQSVSYATSAGDASTLGGTAKGGLFTSLTSASDTKLSITIGGTTKTLSTLYASYAAQLTSAVNLYIADSDATNTGVAVSFSGASNVTLKLPSTIKATLSGNATTATTATKLSTVSKTAWGRTFWTAGGVPDSISGALESVTNITMSGYIKIGSIYIGEDSNGDLEIYKLNNGSHVAANLYARGGVSALGQSSSGGGGGGQGDVTWDLLKSSDTRQINISHLAGDANYAGVMSILTGYTTSGKNYKVQEDSNHHLYVNVPWTDNNTTYTNGTGLSLSGTTFSINSTYQTYISNGNTAYGWGNHASAGYALQTSLNALEYFNSITGGSDIITITTNKSNSTVIDLTHQHSFQELTDKPTTIAGYGITDVYSWARQSTKPSYAFSEITGTATANQIPSIQNINSFGTYVYSAQISRTANTVLAAPNGSAGVASFRSLVAADIPSLSWSKITSGKPTTLSGYGITDACTQSTANGLLYTMSLNNDGTINVSTLGGTTKYSIDFTHQHSFFELVDRPTTIDGYSITGGKFVDDITFVNTKGIDMLNTGNTAKKVMYLSSGNVLVIGSGTSESSYNTYLRGYSVYLKYGTTGATGLMLNSSGNVGIGTTSPSCKLHVDGDIYATGGVTALVATSSDIRKKNVVSYDLPLTINQIADAPTIKFTLKDNAKLGEQVGSIAQYWQKVLPQTIRTEKDDTLSLQYGVAALVSSIITARKVVDHEREIERLKKRVDDLEEENRLLKLKIA